MNAFYLILAASPVLLLGAAAFFALIAAGVRKGDRRDLASPPQNRIDAITRHVIGAGARRDDNGSES